MHYCSTPELSETNFFNGLEMHCTSPSGGTQQAGSPETTRCALFLFAVSDCKRYIVGLARRTKGVMPPKFLENLVILCLERWCHKQNTLDRLKSRDLAPQKVGLATQLD